MRTAHRRGATPSEPPDYATIARALLHARGELVPERWHRGACAVDADGREREPHDGRSVAWCVQGMVLRRLAVAGNPTIRAAIHLLHETASRLSDGRHDTLFAFNDTPSTTIADIHRLLEAAAADAVHRVSTVALGQDAAGRPARLTRIKAGCGACG